MPIYSLQTQLFKHSTRLSPHNSAHSLTQWLLLDEALKHFQADLINYDTIVRTRSVSQHFEVAACVSI